MLHVFFDSPSRPSRQAALSILQHKPKDHGPAVHKNCGTAAACRRYRRMNGIVGHIGSGRDYPLQGPMMKDKVKRQTSSPSNPTRSEAHTTELQSLMRIS